MKHLSADRAPAVTYEKAIRWLLAFSEATVDFINSTLPIDAMPIEAVAIADVYWETKENLRKRLKKALREISPPQTARTRGGWR